MFQIKICGITNPDDARAAAEAGADAIGLNFYAQSKRCVDVERAWDIADALPGEVVKIGLFVDTDAESVASTCFDVGLDLIQLHGDEPPEFLPRLADAGLADVPVMRAFACAGELSDVARYLDECRGLNAMPRLVLLDAAVPGEHGGTGVTCDWEAATAYHEIPGAPAMVLAGGLTLDNVAEAIATVRPAAVDVASGVESAPGRKDKERMHGFVAAAREGFRKTELP